MHVGPHAFVGQLLLPRFCVLPDGAVLNPYCSAQLVGVLGDGFHCVFEGVAGLLLHRDGVEGIQKPLRLVGLLGPLKVIVDSIAVLLGYVGIVEQSQRILLHGAFNRHLAGARDRLLATFHNFVKPGVPRALDHHVRGRVVNEMPGAHHELLRLLHDGLEGEVGLHLQGLVSIFAVGPFAHVLHILLEQGRKHVCHELLEDHSARADHAAFPLLGHKPLDGKEVEKRTAQLGRLILRKVQAEGVVQGLCACVEFRLVLEERFYLGTLDRLVAQVFKFMQHGLERQFVHIWGIALLVQVAFPKL